VKAEEVVTRAVHEAEARFGAASPEYANAQNDLGTVLIYLQEPEQAAQAFARACAVDIPTNEQATRDRLTYTLNWGRALEMAGKLDEAEEVLRSGLQGRAGFYGREHAGYAFGLEPLAEILLRKRNIEEALKLIDEATRNFWHHAHPRVATALALRAEILKAAGSEEPPFADLDELPDEIVERIGQAVLERAGETEPRLSRQVLDDLLPLLTSRFGEDHPVTLNALAAIANLERSLGDSQARQDAIRRAIAAFDHKGELGQALQAVQGLALAQSEAGQSAAAEETYRDAIARAKDLGDHAALAQVLRNYGLLLAEGDRRPEAEQLLRAALTEAEWASDPVMAGRAQIALGIFLYHGGQMNEARDLLTRALERLSPAEPDAVCGRSHLEAIKSGGACGCGDMKQALAQAFREFVMARLPAGIINRLQVDLQGDDFDVEVFLEREPTPEENDLIQRTFRHALAEFRQRVRQER
jgi:tetratricopeptide (TPR) repeat protein